MPFRTDILEMYPNAIRELNRRGVNINYIATNDSFFLVNKEGQKRTSTHAELDKIERELNSHGKLEKIELNLTNELL